MLDPLRHTCATLGFALLTLSCSSPPTMRRLDTVLVDLALSDLQPREVLPGTTLVVFGDSFVDNPWGTSRLRLRGRTKTAVGTERDIDVLVPAQFVDFQHLHATVDDDVLAALGGEGAHLTGTAVVEVDSAVDGSLYRSAAIDIDLRVHEHLAPQLVRIAPDGIVFVNDPMAVIGEGMLLPGEGETVAAVSGCLVAEGQSECVPQPDVEIAVVSGDEFARDEGHFAFMPRIAGLLPGRYEGTVRLRNHHADGRVLDSEALPGAWDIVPPILYGASTDRASLGQYVVLAGAGFVGDGEGDTLLHFSGSFTPDSSGLPVPIDVVLTPEFVSGQQVRYVVNENDAIGSILDVRYEPGRFDGTFSPEITYGSQSVLGDSVQFSFRLEPVRQVVYLDFRPSYVESLRHFGLRAVDQLVRERIFEVVARDFATIGVEVRTEIPQDFELFAWVEIAGPDPNGLGLLGYDNSQGKDTENKRLHDRIGGVNAATGQDGFPAYGGIFLESLFGYSIDPGGFTEPLSPEVAFDALFDEFRPDRGGEPVSSADLADGVPALSSGASCPTDGERRLKVACAIWALANMVGSTISHEIGHSLGLADPYGPFWHNTGDAPNRLMDADRPFTERAELLGDGPSRFCADEYEYLRAILPTADDHDMTPRPTCF